MKIDIGTCVILKDGVLPGRPRSRRAVVISVDRGTGRAEDPPWMREDSYTAWVFGPDNRGSAYGGGYPLSLSVDAIASVTRCKQVEIRALMEARDDLDQSGLVALDKALERLRPARQRRR